MTSPDIIEDIIRREGGYVDRAEDRGGPTKFGITIETLSVWLGHPASVDDVKNLAIQDARAIYSRRYIIDPGFDKIPGDRLRALLVDSGVNHGPARAVKLLQEALGVVADGVIGKNTMNALAMTDPIRVYVRTCAARVRLYGRIIEADHKQAVFAAGWANRVAEFLDAAV